MKPLHTHSAAPLHSQPRPTKRATLALWAGVGVSLMASASWAVEVPQLESLKNEYEERANTGDSFSHLAIAELNAKYITGIKRAQEAAQKAGNLDDALKFEKEGKLIGEGGQVPAEDEAGVPAALKKLRATYRAEMAKIAAQRAKNGQPARDEFRKKLDDLVVSLTKEGKLEEATIVKSYRENNFSSSLLVDGSTPSAIPGKKMSVNLPDGAVMKFVFCPAGEFEMGSPADEPKRWAARESQVKVKLTKGFWIAETECTQKQWLAVMGSNPSHVQGDNLPVDSVSWNEAKGFMAKLNEEGRLPPGLKAALPSEAQWEYACRAGTKTAYNTGKDLRKKEANFGDGDSGKAVAVASYSPNKWGLHDMHGNVCEFCADYRIDKLPGGEDPKGPPGAEFIMHRGGSWFNDVGSARSAGRSLLKPGEKCPNVGFRVVCNVE